MRYGTEPSAGIVYVGNSPILANERIAGMQLTDGHIITLEGIPEQKQIESRLSLFNSLKYRILLSSSHSGVWFAKGHHFDIHSREVSELSPEARFVDKRAGTK
jgi:hypothetical protein